MLLWVQRRSWARVVGTDARERGEGLGRWFLALGAATALAVALIAPTVADAEALPALAPDCPACATASGGSRVINIFGEMNGTPPAQWYPTDTPPPVQGWAAQATTDLSAIEATTSTTAAAGESIGAGLLGAGGSAGFLASPLNLVEVLGPAGLGAADTILLVHDGKLLFQALFGSGPAPSQPEDYTLINWKTYGGSLANSWGGPDSTQAKRALGNAWNLPGWWAQWSLGYNNFATEVNAEAPVAPVPTAGTRLNFKSSWGTHAYYILARDLPGSLQPWNSNSGPADATFDAPSLPSRQNSVSRLNTQLALPEYHTLRLELQHMLDSRCSPDPTSTTVVVPTILPDETPSDYQQCLTTLGLSANVTSLAETDTTVGNGDVVETDPEAGTSVQSGSTVDVAANPQQPQVTQADPRCDVNNGSGSIGDPDNPPSDGTNYPAYQLVQGSPYQAAADPTGSSPAQTQIPLRWGTVGWGWRHILQNHPYTSADQQQTMQALATDTSPTISDGYASTNQWDFHLVYTAPDGSGGTLECARTVRVEYYQDPKAANAGVQGIRGIQNSFTGAYLGGIPGH